jgi:SAM-dependent methyltransferase
MCKGPLTFTGSLDCGKCNIHEQDLASEHTFYENMFSNLTGFDDGHCILYGHQDIYDFINTLEKGLLLEAGCGSGHHSVTLAKKGFEVTGIDLSLSGLLAATKLAEREKQDILFVCGDIKRLPFDDQQFDVCFCSLVLHHFVSLENLVRELTRVTRNSFVAFEVNALDLISFLRFNIMNPLFGIKTMSRNQRAIFPQRLAKLLIDNGFNNIKIDYINVHDSIGKSPYGLRAKMIYLYQLIMKLFPERYSNNKFLLSAFK